MATGIKTTYNLLHVSCYRNSSVLIVLILNWYSEVSHFRDYNFRIIMSKCVYYACTCILKFVLLRNITSICYYMSGTQGKTIIM